MPQYGFRFIDTTLYEFTIRCSRCARVWTDTCLDQWDSADPRTFKNGRYVQFRNREASGQLDCRWGCSHPPALLALARFVMFAFTRKPVFGHGEIVSEKAQSHTRQIIPPGIDAVEAMNIQLEGMREQIRIIESSFKKP